MIKKFAGRIPFVHLRNILIPAISVPGGGSSSSCGSLDMYALVKALVESGFDGYVRPDHGRMIWARKAGAVTAYLTGPWEQPISPGFLKRWKR